MDIYLFMTMVIFAVAVTETIIHVWKLIRSKRLSTNILLYAAANGLLAAFMFYQLRRPEMTPILAFIWGAIGLMCLLDTITAIRAWRSGSMIISLTKDQYRDDEGGYEELQNMEFLSAAKSLTLSAVGSIAQNLLLITYVILIFCI